MTIVPLKWLHVGRPLIQLINNRMELTSFDLEVPLEGSR